MESKDRPEAEEHDPEPRVAAMIVLGLVRRELGVPWDELAIGPGSVTASFSIREAEAESVRLRRRELLVDFVDRRIVGHGREVRRRQLLVDETAERVAAVRGWTGSVAELVARARGLLST